MIDLHCHILPGVDDGATDLTEAVAMCKQAAAEGCQAMVATPHLRHRRWWNNDRLQLEQLLKQLQKEVAEELDLFSGGEIALHTESFDEILDEMPGGSLFSLAGSRYLLLELDWQGSLQPDPREVVYELSVRGLSSIIAHPERVSWLMESPDLLGALVDEGAYLQITAASVTGELGRTAERAAHQLLDRGLVQFVASDAHGPVRRPPGLLGARRLIAEKWGEETAENLFSRYPRAVLENRPLSEPEPEN